MIVVMSVCGIIVFIFYFKATIAVYEGLRLRKKEGNARIDYWEIYSLYTHRYKYSCTGVTYIYL